MATSLQDFESQIQPIIRDRTGNTVETSDIKDSLNRCGRWLMNQYGVYATRDRSNIDIFPDVFEYPVPSDFHDIREIVTPGTPTHFEKKTPIEFWKRLRQENNITAVDTILGDRFLLINRANAGKSTVIHDMDSLTANGTWAVDATTDAVDIAVDTAVKKKGSASIEFDVDVSASVNDYAAIVNSTLTDVDLSSFTNKGTMFIWVWIPDATNVTGFTARWGNGSSNYYSQDATTDHNGQSYRDGWNRVSFAWKGSTETGTVTDTAIDYLYLQVTFDAAQIDDTGFRVDDITMKTPEYMELHYNSVNFVKSSAGVPQAAFSLADDVTIFADQDDDIFLYFALSDAQLIKKNFDERAESLRQRDEMVGFLKARYMSDRKRETYRYY